MNNTHYLFCLSIWMITLLSCQNDSVERQNPQDLVIVGYVPGFRGELDEAHFDPNKITHINYAFVDVKDSMAWLTNIATDTINFRKLNRLKSINPNLKILISIGGWSWSHNFSDAVLTHTSRKLFAESASLIVQQYNLDGVDIDWEYPGLKGEDNIFRPEDKEHFTLMFLALREALDQASSETGKTYLLTSAVAGFKSFLDHTEMSKAAEPQDFINVMCYDYYTSGTMAGHHSNLFPPDDYEQDRSAAKDIAMFIEAGVPSTKLVLGVPFYGRSWIMKSAEEHGINQPVDSVVSSGGYTFIKDSLVDKQGFTYYWDEKAKAPYLFNQENNQLVVFDDEASIKIKCDYVKDHQLRGVMFWQYLSDPKEYLLDVINESFHNPSD